MSETDLQIQHPSSKEEETNCDHYTTKLKVENFNFKWTIENIEFVRLYKTLTKLWSPTFSVKNNGLELQLLLTKLKRGGLGFSIYAKCKTEPQIDAEFILSLQSTSEKRTRLLTNSVFSSVSHENYREIHVFNLEHDKLFNEEKGYLLDNKLTLFCEVNILVDIVEKSSEFKISKGQFHNDLENVSNKFKFSDITMSVDGELFQAHKSILSTRSSVFAAMFEQMKESEENLITITDIDHEVFEEILRYIYTDQTKNIESIADKLLVAADKYELEKLKIICEQVLSKNITIDNVADLFILADLHSSDILKEQTIMFLKKHWATIKITPGWKNTMQSHPKLLVSAMDALFV